MPSPITVIIPEYIETIVVLVEQGNNVPIGGTIGQVLTKLGLQDYTVGWQTPEDPTAEIDQALQDAKDYADDAASTAQTNAEDYADSLVLRLWKDQGNYDASGNTFPGLGYLGDPIKEGYIWTISITGSLGGVPVKIGDTVRALSDVPGQTASNWNISETNIGYVPENSVNKDTDGALNANSDTKYPSQKAVKTYSVKKAASTYYVRDYCVCDNSTNDYAALNALFAATVDGDTVIFPGGQTVFSNGLIDIVDKRLNIKGETGASIRTAANTQMFKFEGTLSNRTHVSGIKFLGNSAGGNQYALYFAGSSSFIISDCQFTGFANGGGIAVTGTQLDPVGGLVFMCGFWNGNLGIDIFTAGEYLKITACDFSGLTKAIQSAAGNINISLNNLTYCETAIEFIAGANNGHSIINDNQINHNTVYGLNIHDTVQGMTISDNHFYVSPIRIANTSGVQFCGGTIDVSTYTFDTNIGLTFQNVKFDVNYGNVITLTGTAPEFTNCYFLSGKSFNYPTASTTDATVTTIKTCVITASTTVCYSGYVVGRRTGGSGGNAEDCALYRVEFVANILGGTAAIVGQSITVIGESQAGWDVTLAASSGNILIKVTGAANNNITWGWVGQKITS